MKDKKNLTTEINPEIRDILIEMGAEDIYKCYQCGKCTSVCPWFQVEIYDYPVFKFSLETALGAVASSEDKKELEKEIDLIYRCVGCEACLDQCPHGISTSNILRAARRLLVDFDSYPDTLKSTVQKTHNVGNPFGEHRENRADWAKGLNVPDFQQGMKFLYFPCCLPAYETRNQKVAQATVGILQKCGISFGILGVKETCCGEVIRRIGAENIFKEVTKTNIKEFNNSGVKKVLVTSPHCFTTFKNEYPDFGADFEVLHTTQYFSHLIDTGKLKINKSFNKKVVYHDPCTLGRKNNIYEEPRNILKGIPELEFLEVEN
ncbi:MAG: (Fe-S)-binding protein, partial [Candidatus Cloacimonetes bacterium]|nr:(Fe-S)-binding protein [Candidatus Cloacimonadota bacterium]